MPVGALMRRITSWARSEKFIELRGMRVRVAIDGHGPPLLLINGLGANIEMWEPLRRLLRGRQTIAFDAPGAGASDWPVVPLRMRDLAGVVNELLDELGYGVVDVLGYSLGGAVAQQFAHQYPRRVRRLVLAATVPGVGAIQNPVTLMEVVTLPLRGRHAPGRRKAVARVVGGQAGRDATAMAAVESAQQAHPPARVGFAHQLLAIAGWSSVPWLHTIGAPTLVLAGERDPLVPAINNEIFTALMPDCREHIVRRAGHLFLIDQAEDVGEVIDDFLAGGEPSSADRETDAATRLRRRSLLRQLRRRTDGWGKRARAAAHTIREKVERQARRSGGRGALSERRDPRGARKPPTKPGTRRPRATGTRTSRATKREQRQAAP